MSLQKTKNNLEPKYLGPPLIYEGTYQFDSKALITKFQRLANDPRFKNFGGTMYEVGNAGSTAFTSYPETCPHNLPELKEFSNWVLECSKDIFKDWEMIYNEPIIERSWVNKHGKGGWTNWHLHENAELVVSAYIKFPNNGGNLLMADPLENHWFGMRSFRTLRSTKGMEIPVEESKVLFFAPFIRHSTQPNESYDDRWVLSMNIMCGKDGTSTTYRDLEEISYSPHSNTMRVIK